MTVRRSCASAFISLRRTCMRALATRAEKTLGVSRPASWLTKARLDHLPGRRHVGAARREPLRSQGLSSPALGVSVPNTAGWIVVTAGEEARAPPLRTAAETAASSAAPALHCLRRRRRLHRLRRRAPPRSPLSAAPPSSAASALLLLRRRLARRLPRTPPRGLSPPGSRPARFRSRGSRERLLRLLPPRLVRGAAEIFQTPRAPPPRAERARTPVPRTRRGSVRALRRHSRRGSPQ